MSISDDGTYAVGAPTEAEWSRTLQIRRLSDGSLVHTYRFGKYQFVSDVWWEDAHTMLIAVADGDNQGARLVRCRLHGTCNLAGAYVPGHYSHFRTYGWA